MKFLKYLIVSLAVLVLPLTAPAQNFHAIDMLGGARSFQLTNNATVNYNASLVPFTNLLGGTVYSLTNLYSTNGIITPGTVLTNSSTWANTAWIDVPVFSDRNGNAAAAAFALAWIGDTAKSTNTITITLAKLTKNNAGVFVPGTQTADKWTLLLSGSQAAGAMVTNVPAALIQGAAGLRVNSIGLSDGSGAASLNITAMSINGYVP